MPRRRSLIKTRALQNSARDSGSSWSDKNHDRRSDERLPHSCSRPRPGRRNRAARAKWRASPRTLIRWAAGWCRCRASRKPLRRNDRRREESAYSASRHQRRRRACDQGAGAADRCGDARFAALVNPAFVSIFPTPLQAENAATAQSFDPISGKARRLPMPSRL